MKNCDGKLGAVQQHKFIQISRSIMKIGENYCANDTRPVGGPVEHIIHEQFSMFDNQ